jgi:hypothetical protein
MVDSPKPEFRPLLPLGRHPHSVQELEALCVTAFPTSQTRRAIMDGLVQVVERLLADRIEGEIWVDGSFLTEKTDPEDVDIVLRCRGEWVERSNKAQQAAILWVAGNLHDSHHCHSFVLFEFDEGHPMHVVSHYWYCYWMRQWGFSRGSEDRPQEMKGIAVLQLLRSAKP